MKVGIMQPYFIPYIGYWQLINAVDKYIIYDDVNYIKGGWINRNQILLNGKAHYINVQMHEASPNKKINEITINKNKMYINKNLRMIIAAYEKAPYFKEGYELIESIFYNEQNNLAKFITDSIKEVCHYLNITTEILISSEIVKNNLLKGQEKVIDICRSLGGTKYFNAIGGLNLYSYDEFIKYGIKLSFIKSNVIEYKQFDNEFVPNLSILDVIMFNSRNEITGYLKKYSLIENNIK